MITFFRNNYNVKILAEDFDSLVDLAISVNKREKAKNQRQNKGKNVGKGELFVYGEFKLFSWALLLYCIFKEVNLEFLVFFDSFSVRKTIVSWQKSSSKNHNASSNMRSNAWSTLWRRTLMSGEARK